MIRLKRTSYDDPDFGSLIKLLNKDLLMRYPETQQHYAPLNVIKQNANVVIAYVDGEAAGCGCYRDAAGESTVEIKRMYVREENRGQGIAHAVLRELEAWALEEGKTEAILETGPRNHEALALYRKLGYAQIENYEPYVNMKESICMGKSLLR